MVTRYTVSVIPLMGFVIQNTELLHGTPLSCIVLTVLSERIVNCKTRFSPLYK